MSVRPWLKIEDMNRPAGVSALWFWSGQATILGSTIFLPVYAAATKTFMPSTRPQAFYVRIGSAMLEPARVFKPLTARARAAMHLVPTVARLVSEATEAG